MRLDLYQLAHTIKDKAPFVWDAIETVNEWLFLVRYKRQIKNVVITTVPDGYELVKMCDVPTEKIVAFFECQPAEAFTFFNPHKFDAKSIKRLQKNKSYLAYMLLDKSNDKIVVYGFNRCYFMGKAFRGRMVDIDYRGEGLGTPMSKILNEVVVGVGLRLFTTISPDNYASLSSTKVVNDIKILRILGNGYYYIKCTPKNSSGEHKNGLKSK